MEKIRPFDTIEGQTNSSEINKYAKVFSNGSFFTEIYPMAIKADAGIALKTFITKLGFPERITIDVSKEQNTLVT